MLTYSISSKTRYHVDRSGWQVLMIWPRRGRGLIGNLATVEAAGIVQWVMKLHQLRCPRNWLGCFLSRYYWRFLDRWIFCNIHRSRGWCKLTTTIAQQSNGHLCKYEWVSGFLTESTLMNKNGGPYERMLPCSNDVKSTLFEALSCNLSCPL